MRELHSRRLFLKPLRPDDLVALRDHWSEPAVRRYLWDGQVISSLQVDDAIVASAGLFERHGVGLWGIRLIGTPGLIGCGGFWYFHEPPELELLLSLSRHHWGRGLAQEAAAALIDYAFDELEWTTVQASADAPNRRSLRLMRRLGMRPAGERPGEFGSIEVYGITAAEWHGHALDVRGSA
jgi:[ribosomal protein S5]-alanine N-acetyltransferase